MTAAKPFVVDDTVVKEKTLFVICDRFFYEIFGKFAVAKRADVGLGLYRTLANSRLPVRRTEPGRCWYGLHPRKNPLPERLLRQGVLRVCYSISSRLDEAGTSFCFGSVTRRTPSEYAALMPAASMPEISKLLA